MMHELGTHQKTVALLVRIGPIPPGIQNTLLAVSPVHTFTFVWSSFVGLLIKQVPLTFVGSGVKDIMEITQGGEGGGNNAKDITVIVLGGVGALCLFVLGCVLSKKAVDTAKRIQAEEEGLLEESEIEMEATPQRPDDDESYDSNPSFDLDNSDDIILTDAHFTPMTLPHFPAKNALEDETSDLGGMALMKSIN